jgi:hypothetical protein
MKTLGYYRNFATAIFGADSKATKYIEDKIREQGEDEPVLADETQMYILLMELYQQDVNTGGRQSD